MTRKPARAARIAGLAGIGAIVLGVADQAATQGRVTEPRTDRVEPADVTPRPEVNLYGVTGAIDTPTALNQPDGEVNLTTSYFGGTNRNTLSFQILPRVQGTFRYTGFYDLDFAGFEDYYDRSFDLSFQVLDEGRYLPAVKVGLQDFVGTGLYSGEYVVATKRFFDNRLTVSGGLGWGRLAGTNQIGTLVGDRPDVDIGRGGKPNTDQWFRGEAAPFASVQYRATDSLTLMAEYSSDAYQVETGEDPVRSSSAQFDRKSDFNFGATYRVNDGVDLGAYYLYGSELGVKLSFALNPARPPVEGSIGPAPGPVQPRPDRATSPEAYAQDWAAAPGAQTRLIDALARDLGTSDFTVESLTASGTQVEVRVRNDRYGAEAQAIGRIARAMTRTMPASVELFRIVATVDGLPSSAVTLRRSDIEATVNAPNGAARLLAATDISDAGARPAEATLNAEVFPRFDWRIGPYIRRSYFDPDNPYRADAGIRASASFEPTPGLIFSGSVAKKVVGNLDENRRESNSVLPRVRTNFPIYDREGDPALEKLQAAYYFKPGDDLYGRVTAGYLERMFGGVSAEVLWKPVDSRLGVGAELNYVKQRDFDLQLGFQDYDVVTGHVSAYYAFDNGFHAQVDVGRYLAGDIGATLHVKREFRNGWSLGAFATLTDVSSDEFGEGSFDKGITVSVPISWFTGKPTTRQASTTIRPVTRDGGARLSVDGRLYERVRSYHEDSLGDQWGRVWR